MFKIQTVLNFSMKNQIFLSSKIHKRNSEWTYSKFTYHRPNLEPNFKLSYWFSSIKNLLSFKKQKKLRIQRLFDRSKINHSNQILNYIVQTPPNHFSKNFIKKVKLYSPKTEIQNERFIQSLYFIRIVCSNIKSPFGQRKFYDYPTSANIQDLKRCPRPCERVRANW